jgi:cobalt-zinc-cadmium efflux system outer membrane protein
MGSQLIPLLVLLVGGTAAASTAHPAFTDDPQLNELVGEALTRRPELAQARAEIRAGQEQAPQSRALPDPRLTVGIQNDGFSSIQIGTMATSFLAVTASQTFPWAGKRRLRGNLAELAVAASAADLRRVELSIRADVERAYLDLLLVRDRLALLGRLQSLWSQSEVLARVRYEAGEAAQSELLRAQLEQQRLRQQRWSLEAEERRRVVILNRLRDHPLDEAIPTSRRLTDLRDPVVPDATQAMATAEATSPELNKAIVTGQRATGAVALAGRERWPDVTVSAGIMPRGGNFPMMWQASVGVNLPVWSAQKQSRAVSERQAQAAAAASATDASRQLLRQRVQERLAALAALVQSNQLYRSDLLIQSETTVTSTLAQYQVGRITFAAVLEALAGYLADSNGFLDAIAAAQRLAIAEREVSLEVGGEAASSSMGNGAGPSARPATSAGSGNEGGASARSGM